MGRPLTVEELDEVSGGELIVLTGTKWSDPGVTSIYDPMAIRALGQAMDSYSQLAHHNTDSFSSYPDQDGDGVIDSKDIMNGGDDNAWHLEMSDGQVMGDNGNGTFTLYDASGNAMSGLFVLTGMNVNTGGSNSSSSDVGANVGPSGVGVNAGVAMSVSHEGNTYSYTYYAPGTYPGNSGG